MSDSKASVQGFVTQSVQAGAVVGVVQGDLYLGAQQHDEVVKALDVVRPIVAGLPYEQREEFLRLESKLKDTRVDKREVEGILESLTRSLERVAPAIEALKRIAKIFGIGV